MVDEQRSESVAVPSFHNDLQYAERSRERLDRHFYPRMAADGRFVPLGRSDGSMYLQTEAHIDVIVASHSGGSVTVEEKLVRWPGYEYTALAVETHSNLERTGGQAVGDGWIATSRADYLLYAFEQPGGRLKVWVFDLPGLRQWFAPRVGAFPYSDTRNDFYTTRCRVVPLSSIPARLVRVRAKLV